MICLFLVTLIILSVWEVLWKGGLIFWNVGLLSSCSSENRANDWYLYLLRMWWTLSLFVRFLHHPFFGYLILCFLLRPSLLSCLHLDTPPSTIEFELRFECNFSWMLFLLPKGITFRIGTVEEEFFIFTILLFGASILILSHLCCLAKIDKLSRLLPLRSNIYCFDLFLLTMPRFYLRVCRNLEMFSFLCPRVLALHQLSLSPPGVRKSIGIELSLNPLPSTIHSCHRSYSILSASRLLQQSPVKLICHEKLRPRLLSDVLSRWKAFLGVYPKL